MVEHIMRVIMGLCDRIAVIQYGTKIAEGPTKEVTTAPKVLEAYLGEDYDL
jgi:branched-chain amino acid transport system ATP-binding protein